MVCSQHVLSKIDAVGVRTDVRLLRAETARSLKRRPDSTYIQRPRVQCESKPSATALFQGRRRIPGANERARRVRNTVRLESFVGYSIQLCESAKARTWSITKAPR